VTAHPESPRVVVAGGGTAGHIEPAMNLADAIRRLEPSAEITAIGSTKGLDSTLIPARGYRLELVPPVPLPRRPGRDLLATPGRVRAAVATAGEILERVRAEVVVGFGGYVAVPAYLAAKRRNLPIVVHEANAKPGLANRSAARLTKHVFTASARAALPHATVIGIPLRPDISQLDRPALRGEARARFGLDPDRPTLLVTGGSQGARRINESLGAVAADLGRAGVQVLHVSGPKGSVPLPASEPGAPPYVVVAFEERMELAYAAADAVVGRAGASSVTETAALGLPAVFVPLPIGNGEQAANAEAVVAAGGAVLVADADFTPDWARRHLPALLTDRARLDAMSRAAAGLLHTDADEALASLIIGVAR